jgi:serine/threonine-protein kinase
MEVLARVEPSGNSGTSTATDEVFAGTPYRVVRKLGQGGMGEVFLVKHEEIGRELVAKLLHRRLVQDERLLDRVRIEAHSLARLHDQNVVQVTDFRRTREGRPFLVMEHLLGRTLKQELVARKTLPLLDALDFMHQALCGLAAAHALGIVHRDIKPENLFLSDELDGSITLKVLDFGLARVIPGVSDEGPQPLAIPTETDAVLGTPRYMSPEAAVGKRVDHRADLYALALVFYECVAEVGPFENFKHDFLNAHALEEPAAPSRLASRPIPTELDALILRGLRKNPEARYQSAAEFQREIEQLWTLLNDSQALKTTTFSTEERSNIRTTGQLRRQLDTAATPNVSERSPQCIPAPEATNATPRSRVALWVASAAVALITAVVVTSAIVAVLMRTSP